MLGLGVEPGIEHFAHARIGGSQYGSLAGAERSNRIEAGHGDERDAKRCSQALRHTGTDAQAGKCARALGIGDGGQFVHSQPGRIQQGGNLRQDEFRLPVAGLLME